MSRELSEELRKYMEDTVKRTVADLYAQGYADGYADGQEQAEINAENDAKLSADNIVYEWGIDKDGHTISVPINIKTNGWIPVSKRLPQKDGRYLVTFKYSGYGNGNYTYNTDIKYFSNNLDSVDEFDFINKHYPGWYDYDSEYGYYECGDSIIAWMPLTDAYKEDAK